MTINTTIKTKNWLPVLPSELLELVTNHLSPKDNCNLLLSKVQGVKETFIEYKIPIDVWIKLDKETILKKFKSGIEEYKKQYVEENYPDINVKNVYFDLSGLDLSGLEFWYVDFQGANCSGTNFQGAKLWYADFQGANCSGANFTEAYLKATIFNGANCSGVDLFAAKLQWIDFRGAELQGARFKSAKIKNADFREANLEGADLDGVYIFRTIFPKNYSQ